MSLTRGARTHAGGEEGPGAGEGIEFALCLDSLLGSLTALPASTSASASIMSSTSSSSTSYTAATEDSAAFPEDNAESEAKKQEEKPEEQEELLQAEASQPLDAPASAGATDKGGVGAAKLYMHVSRQPKPDSSLAALYQVIPLKGHSTVLEFRAYHYYCFQLELIAL